MIKNWSRIALLNFFFAACLGALMRYAFVEEITWINYRYVMHGHSHVAMLGWLYMALYALLIHVFLTPKQQQKPIYHRLFWLSQISIVGMLISFPLQGYGIVSVCFSTLHLLLSYVFVWRFWFDIRQDIPLHNHSKALILAALLFQVLSSLGLWGMGLVIGLQLQASVWYYITVQFYLHFQFNGWYLFAALALLLQIAGQRGIFYQPRQLKIFHWCLVLATLITFSLVLSWAEPQIYLFRLNGIGVLLQLVAIGVLANILYQQRTQLLAVLSKHAKLLLTIALLCLCLKALVQSSVIIPEIAQAGYTIRNLVISFFHLLLLGVISHFIFFFAVGERLIWMDKPLSNWGFRFFFVGFLLSEMILAGQGILFWMAWGFMPFYYELLFFASLLMPIGILLLSIGQFERRLGSLAKSPPS